ncbi:AbiJ-NTD4 domain-containing protein [Acinetobacter shaoyimingii]|uniref:HEPN AbiJ-N-terminal domain-containing protein n=1 Tax=Acinetobacter shaoyimingii TaxID=2715164 RepID=A0A6G8RS95_9GAMM|nr:hypothetical protein [Acinetobacter shaoyimingii]QIO04658.1 hypothetical protein G8E00_01130 [Acinetobacter shaoyimingii]
MRFSERYGYKAVREIIQKESMDDILKNKLWSILYSQIFDNYSRFESFRKLITPLISKIWCDYLKLPLDEKPAPHKLTAFIKDYLYKNEWYAFYDLIEFIIQNKSGYISFGGKTVYSQTQFTKVINLALESENSAYRIINEEIVEITSEQEVQSIEEALQNSNPYSGVQQHLNQALQLMSDRQNPDYRNSIKDSISAVESICKIVTNDDKASLGQALKIIETKYGLHEALKKSLSQLYGYTSDADGIRHAMLEESNLTYIDAKFMLVACTNFINYLIDKTKDQI